MYKGRYVAVIEYDFVFNNHDPDARPIEQIQEQFRSGVVETGLTDLLRNEAFDADIGKWKVTQTLFDMYELPEPPKEE